MSEKDITLVSGRSGTKRGHWWMGGRRWKRAGGQSGCGESRQGCLKKGCVLQTAAITGQCVGNMKYINRQQLGLQHRALPTTKGDDLSRELGPARVSHSTPALGPVQLDLGRSLPPPW